MKSTGSIWRRGQKTQTRHFAVATVEFALILPVFLGLLMGVMEFGWYMRNQQMLGNATREGVRYAALGNTSTAVRTRIKNAASGLRPALTDSQIVLAYTSDRTSDNPMYYSWPADVTTKNGVEVGNLIQITVNYPHKPFTAFFPFFNNRTISVSTTMARENN